MARPNRSLPSRSAPTDMAPVRRMMVIAQDPGRRDAEGLIVMAAIEVPAERLAPGPRGYRVHVVDYEPASGRYAGAHRVPERLPKSWIDGQPHIARSPAFRAANVYALVMKTLARFEYALGRRVGWGFDSHQIHVAPRGVPDANAYYSRRDQGLVFGWFVGQDGQVIDTCLSHDIVVHETTHALIDGLRERYMDPSSPDQAAFHEGFADVIALLSVLSQKELVARLLDSSKTFSKGQIAKSALSESALHTSALLGLAEEMGRELDPARGSALRRSVAIREGRSWRSDPEYDEPHFRGEILVAAILKTFVKVWRERISKLGEVQPGRVSLERVAEDGAEAADYLATMLIRSLDYMPPVHVEFEDVLSAMLTADQEIRPDDSKYHFRLHLLRGFRAFGIEPAPGTAEETGTWTPAPSGLRLDRVHLESLRTDEDEVFRFVWENRAELKLHEEAYTKVISVRPCMRMGSDGFFLRETVAEYFQLLRLEAQELRGFGIHPPAEMPHDTEVRLYGGGTLVFDEFGRLKFHVSKEVLARATQSQRLEYLWRYGHFGKGGSFVGRLSTMHRMRALGTHRHSLERW